MEEGHDEVMKEILTESKTIAVVGLSDKVHRSSYGVAEYLSEYFEIIPVNPMIESWKGKKSYRSVAEIPEEVSVDMVDIFRRSEEVVPIVQDAVKRGVKYIWMQQGVVNQEAEAIAKEAGVKVVMDACAAVVHASLVRG